MKYYCGDEVVVRCNNLFKSINKNGVITKIKKFKTYGNYAFKKNYKVIYVQLEDGSKVSIKDKGGKIGFKRYKIIEVLK